VTKTDERNNDTHVGLNRYDTKIGYSYAISVIIVSEFPRR